MKMNQIIPAALAAFVLAATTPTLVQATPKVTASVAVYNKDIIGRGFVLSQDPFAQPEVRITTENANSYVATNQKYNLAEKGADRGIWFGAGTNFALPNKIGNVNVEVGQLSLPNGWKVPELYTSTSLNLPLKPTIEAVVSGGDFAGNYFSAGLSQSKKFGNATFTIAGKVGYNDNYGSNFSAFSHANIDATVAVPIAKNVTLSGGVRQQYGLHQGVPTDRSFNIKTTYKF